MSLPVVIVPVFNALDLLEACLESLIRTVPHDTRVVLIEDASTDAAVRPFLKAWVGNAPLDTRLVCHAENRGFVASANHGMQLANADLVLLNSDTVVTNGWLQRLEACLQSDETIATATPWSNNGEIVSLPQFCFPNPVPANPDAMAGVVASSGSPVYPELPTAVGFCMAISKRAIQRIGYFDEATFGRGYGEENDFCQRAEKAGLRNVLCDDAYVVHHGGASFGPLDIKPDANSMKRLLDKHPDYERQVASFIHEDPLSGRRQQIVRQLRVAGLVN